jgi:hypothetical protein
MDSIALQTYPQVVWRQAEKRLWNPIHRKPLKNRPEERVRLRIIEALLLAGWSRHRISTEEAIGSLADRNMRTDIICYNQQFDPQIIVECKAEHISISGKTAEQVTRYNQKVEAPYVLMTNGVTDFWYHVNGEAVDRMQQGPDLLDQQPSSPNYDYTGWQQRGFAGGEADPELRKWLAKLLPGLWHQQPAADIQFLSFNQALSDLDLSHYYLLQSISDHERLALSTLSTEYGGSRLMGILNENNQNKAVLEINLDLLFDDQPQNTTIYSSAGTQSIDGSDIVRHALENITGLVEQIYSILTGYSE